MFFKNAASNTAFDERGTARRRVASCLRDPLLAQAFVVITLLFACYGSVASACPFCTSLPRTLSDDLEESTAAVVARCEAVSSEADGFRVCRMRITGVVKGEQALMDSVVKVESVDELPCDAVYWIVGYGETELQWDPPQKISADAAGYLRGLSGVPQAGSERLGHFLGFLKHSDEFIAADAYNEFAEASLEDIGALGDTLDRRWVIAQLRDTSVPLHRRRLCWTFLSQCGTADDVRLFEEALKKRRADATFKPGMGAAIACYIALGGEPALARIERDYLVSPAAEYSDSFAAIKAIRVHGTEMSLFQRQRLATALRRVLARPTLADLVIPDLARWEDWSAIDRMVELFATSTDESPLVKPAAVLYLKTCPLAAGRVALDKLRAIDPAAVHRAEASMTLYPGLPSVPVPPPSSDESISDGATLRR